MTTTGRSKFSWPAIAIAVGLAGLLIVVLVLIEVTVISGLGLRSPKHGVGLVVGMGTHDEAMGEPQGEWSARTRAVLEKRLNRAGLHFSIEPLDGGRLLVKLRRGGSNDLAVARAMIARSGQLEFRLVHPESADLITNSIPEPGYELLRESRVMGTTGRSEVMSYLVKKEPERGLTGRHIRRASVSRGQVTGQPEIQFEFDADGAQKFAEVTREYSPKNGRYHQLAIVVDGVLYSAPRIAGVISGGRGQISGSFTLREATSLANVLENPIDWPIQVIEERSF